MDDLKIIFNARFVVTMPPFSVFKSVIHCEYHSNIEYIITKENGLGGIQFVINILDISKILIPNNVFPLINIVEYFD